MRLYDFLTPGYVVNGLQLSVFGNSDDNNFLPLISLYNVTVFKVKGLKKLVYNMEFSNESIADHTGFLTRTHRTLKPAYRLKFLRSKYFYREPVTDIIYYSDRGILFTLDEELNPTILLMFCITKRMLQDMLKSKDYYEANQKVIPSECALVINANLDLKQYPLARLLIKDFENEKFGNDVIYTYDIMKYGFVNNIKPRFKTLQERIDYLKNLKTII